MIRICGLLTKIIRNRGIININAFSTTSNYDDDNPKDFRSRMKREDPFERVYKILKNDLKMTARKVARLMGFYPLAKHDPNSEFFPTHTDILIIGGGITGSSIAYWLKQRVPNGMDIIVLEKDSTYKLSSVNTTSGELNLLHHTPENVQMSLFGAEFLRMAHKHLSIDDRPYLQFNPHGRLTLASIEDSERLKEDAHQAQRIGTNNIILTKRELKTRFPWLNTTGVELGCLGLQMEGSFSAGALLSALQQKSINLGADYIEGALIGFEFSDQPLIVAPSSDGKYKQLTRAMIELTNEDILGITFGICIIASGAESAEVAKMAKIGYEEELLSVPLPIKPRKRYTFQFDCPDGPVMDMPGINDVSSIYVRKEGLGDSYVATIIPEVSDESAFNDEHVNPEDFQSELWPILKERVNGFDNPTNIIVEAGLQQHNIMDGLGIIGPHPYYHNLFLACGFDSVQYAPAVGKAAMELILDGEFKTINLARFNFDRVCLDEPISDEKTDCN